MKIAVFVYDFPHKKSQDIMFRLRAEDIPVSCVIANPFVKLINSNKPNIRVKPMHENLMHPKKVAKSLKYTYYITAHNSSRSIEILKKHNIDIGIIAGARILKHKVIDACKIGILNIHPGILPQARGLDSLKWAIYENHPLGVTVHFIDENIDAGKIVIKKQIPVYSDDTLIDLSLRLEEKGVDLLISALQLVVKNKKFPFKKVGKGKLHTRMPLEKEEEMAERFRTYINKWSK